MSLCGCRIGGAGTRCASWCARLLRSPYPAPHSASASAPISVWMNVASSSRSTSGWRGGESIGQHGGPGRYRGQWSSRRFLCSSDFGRSLEESRDDLQSLGYDTPVPLIRSDSYTTLLDATVVPQGPRSRVSGMQAKLHRWTAADSGRRFDDLFNFVHDPATLIVAFDRVAGNTGANTPGVDGLTVADVDASIGMFGFLDDLRNQLKDGSFRPLPVRERKIPKPGGNDRDRPP